MVGLVSAFPQMVWLSEHKGLVFSLAGLLLLGSGVLIWRARSLPCPADLRSARACRVLRRASLVLYGTAATAFTAGTFFAFAF